MSATKLCKWCSGGKPPEVPGFKNPNCDKCALKPDEVNGIRLRTSVEWLELVKKLNYVAKPKKGHIHRTINWVILRGFKEPAV